MTPSPKKTVDDYIESQPQWSEALTMLRKILDATKLVGTIKWGAPCYTLGGKNVLGMVGFKNHIALWFYQGVFLKDELGVLSNAQEGSTRGLRQWRFNGAKDIKVRAVKAYVLEAIENQKQGKAIQPATKPPLTIPVELGRALEKNPKVKAAFAKLSPGRQREYAEHINSAKREQTRESRVAKILPMIKSGVGLNDKYK